MSDEQKQRENGGPAFPHGPLGGSWTAEDGHTYHQEPASAGMTLRDYFAGQALAAMIQACGVSALDCNNHHLIREILPCEAYKVADVMLEERNS